MKGIIYAIKNPFNLKVYIGKTTENPIRYWNLHKSRAERGRNKVLYSAMRKYGIEHFTFEIIEEIERENVIELNNALNLLEIKYIADYKSLVPNGYNVTIGGEGTKGVLRDQQFKDNLRKLKTGVTRPEWVKEKLRKPKTEAHKLKLKKPKSEEHKQKLKEIWASFSEEKRQEIFNKGLDSRRDYNGENNPFYGKSHSEEFVEWIKQHNKEYQNREDIKMENKLKQPHRIPVNMIDPTTNEIVESFIGLREAKKWIAENTKYKGDVSTISDAVNLGRISYGYKWERND